ncbi:MAG: monofunctional biosynthetic peptidoglycan transglycosylase [Bacteroidales bacterium]|nr:monofunctional biosynthetic peptidoglycan transglycosylase [Bacteroidales bacterium]
MRRFLKFLFIKLPLAFILLTVLWVVVLKWVPVWVTPLMIKRSIEYREDKDFKTQKKWKSLDEISPELVRAVIASEDNRFGEHDGFDRVEIKRAIDDHKNKGKRLRGASTISQQTAKNVFCYPSRSMVRKGFEAYFTFLIEKIWGKRRIMEVYLNVAEMGKGIYGAEAAARTHFRHDAASLTRRESCLIAACLPNPIKRNAGNPSNYVNRRAIMIASLEMKLEYPDWVRRK